MPPRPTRPPGGGPRRPPATRATRAALAIPLLLGALLYTTWTVEAFLPTGLSPLQVYVSELAARDQPYGTFFRTADLLAGLLVLAGAVGALVWLPRRGWAVAGWAGLALFGAATAADSQLALSCAPTADAACAAREAAGDVPWTHSAHTVSSSVAVGGALLGMVLLTVAARRGAGAWPALARTGPVLVVLEVAATGWTLASVAAFEAGRGTWALGVGQRLQVLFIAVWIAVLAWSVAAAASPRERRG
ncbi:DUF998 domain-containing protein [Streptomyces sp. WAC 01529]|uniref:DUF998 domain-containing protein n=1 Tax=Streptomyces sp. WAC 01529 TaxID=2203205 RepID=UPI000F712ED8|nr:DUF998 domain-containing protein [Streptomyces sp. WAC 01529]AZM52903.1 DUF998 domain-containing protein [Streptomyces sp. WAC 01529]